MTESEVNPGSPRYTRGLITGRFGVGVSQSAQGVKVFRSSVYSTRKSGNDQWRAIYPMSQRGCNHTSVSFSQMVEKGMFYRLEDEGLLDVAKTRRGKKQTD